MAAVTRRTDSALNRAADIFPSGRRFLFFKERFDDDVEAVGQKFIIVHEIDDTTRFVPEPAGPGIDADWDEWERIGLESDYTLGPQFTLPEVRNFNLIVWWTWIQKRRMKVMLSDVIAAGLNTAQRRHAFVGAMVASGVDGDTARALAADVAGLPSIEAIGFNQLNLNNAPRFFREKLRAQADQ